MRQAILNPLLNIFLFSFLVFNIGCHHRNTNSGSNSLPKYDNAPLQNSEEKRNSNGDRQQTTTDNLPDLPGTDWSLKSMTKRGEAIKEYDVMPNMDFCQSGAWALYHYGGAFEGGKYQITGTRIIFR